MASLSAADISSTIDSAGSCGPSKELLALQPGPAAEPSIVLGPPQP